MPVRPYRPPLRKNRPWAYHAGATTRGVVNKAGRGAARSAERASVDKIAQAINLGVDAFIQLLIVLTGNFLVILILLFWMIGQFVTGGNTIAQFALKAVGLNPSVFGLNSQALEQVVGDLKDLGEPIKVGQVFNRYDGGSVTVNSGFGNRLHPIHKTHRHHPGIDLPLESGYPLFAWTETEVNCTVSGGYGNLATLKLSNGQVYRGAHLSSCTSGGYQAGQIYGRVGTTGTSTANHLHWEQKDQFGRLVHPRTNPLQATLTGKWPGGGASSTGGIDMDFIKNLEGFHPTAYVDGSEGGRTRWSWGYGTKAPGPGQTISQEQAHQDMVAYLDRNCLPHIPESLTPNQKTAAASLCYNVGPGVTGWSIWKDIQAGGNPAFTSYTRNTAGANLLPRRQKEQSMWEGK